MNKKKYVYLISKGNCYINQNGEKVNLENAKKFYSLKEARGWVIKSKLFNLEIENLYITRIAYDNNNNIDINKKTIFEVTGVNALNLI